MRNTLIALAAATGLIGSGIAVSAAPVHGPVQASSALQCGSHCEHPRYQASHQRRAHHQYYSYNNGYYGRGSYYHYYH